MKQRWRQEILWPFALLAVVIVVAQAMHRGLSGDVYWQWAAGRLMIRLGHVLTRDPFSYTLYHMPWVADEWGYEVLLAASIKWLGADALWIFSAGLSALALVATGVRLRRHSDDGIKAGLILILSAVALEPFVKDRPQTLSYVLFALVLWLLEISRTHSRLRFLLVPLLWVWVLCHGSFLLGFALVLGELIYAWWVSHEKAADLRPRILVLGMAGLASWINPYGWSLWVYVVHVSTDSAIANTITEWQSPNFHLTILKIAIWVPVLALVATGWRRRRTWLSYDGVWTAILLLATLQSVRFLPYFALEWGIPVLIGSQGLTFRHVNRLILAGTLVVLSAFLLFSQPIIPPGQVAASEPTAEVNFLKDQPDHGRVFNYYVWGGYLIWRSVPVFIDGRTDFYLQRQIFQQYVAIQNLEVDPEPIFQRWHIRYVLWPPSTPLATFLLASGDWKLIYQTSNALLFEHRGAWGPVVTVGRG